MSNLVATSFFFALLALTCSALSRLARREERQVNAVSIAPDGDGYRWMLIDRELIEADEAESLCR